MEWTPSSSSSSSFSSLLVEDVETVAESNTLTSAPNSFAICTFPVLSKRLLSVAWAYPPPVAL